MDFYHSVFGGELDVSTWSEMPDMPGYDPAMADKLMHSMLNIDDAITLMGADTPDSPGPKGAPISVSLSGDDEARAARLVGQAVRGREIRPRSRRRRGATRTASG